jgi:hypothetical protein
VATGGSGGAAGAATCVTDTYGVHEYAFCESLRTWSQAQADCQSRGMTLVRVDDADENSWVHSTANFQAVQQEVMWIGGTDLAQEGEWLWTDGTQFWTGGLGGSPYGGAFASWDSGEPNNNGDEDCLGMIIHLNGVWNDQPCSFTRPFVCESSP